MEKPHIEKPLIEKPLIESTTPPAISIQDYRAEETLLDGRIMHIRTLQPADREAIIHGLQNLSAESIYFRFMAVRHQLSESEISYFTQLDFVNHVALVATLSLHGVDTPVGGGRYVVVDPQATTRHAEVAFTVEDAYHGLGIGTHLFHHLEKLARAQGINYFDADVHSANQKMIDVFTHLGLPMTTSRDGNIMHIELRL